MAGLAAARLVGRLDLGVVGRRLPRVRALPLLPQLADHLVHGAIVGVLLRRGGEGRPARPAPPSDP